MSREISQRELRSNAAAVLRAVASGESFVVTCQGRPVAMLSAGAGKPTFETTARRVARV